jgi:PAS domain S-box-containing protein
MLYGWRREDVLGRIDSQVLQMPSDPAQTAEITAKLASGESWSGEFTVRHRDGFAIPVHWTGAAAHDVSGDAIGYVGVATDLRRFKEAEQQLRQGLRLESIGRLAGGVAHDFNNLLTSIKGITRMMLDDVASGSPMRPDLEEIERSADRAATLTSQLLAFGRRQVLQPRNLDLNEIIRDVEPMLTSVMKFDVDLVLDLDPDLGRARVDATQIAQAIVNLALHARDASPAHASVTIRTLNAELDDFDARQYAYPVRRGSYVVLSVHDAGPALEQEDLEHIFEPFYTMKRPGAGNGLWISFLMFDRFHSLASPVTCPAILFFMLIALPT